MWLPWEKSMTTPLYTVSSPLVMVTDLPRSMLLSTEATLRAPG